MADVEIKAQGVVTQVYADKVNEKSNGKKFITAQVKITSSVGRGLIVLANRTLDAGKSQIAVGQDVTLHGHTFDNNGVTDMRFEIQTGVSAVTGADLLKAFGVKTTVLQPQVD